MRLTECNNIPSLLKTVLYGRVDGAYVCSHTATHHLRNRFGTPHALVPYPGISPEVGSYQLATRKHPEVIHEFDEFLAANTELVRRLRQKHRYSQFLSATPNATP